MKLKPMYRYLSVLVICSLYIVNGCSNIRVIRPLENSHPLAELIQGEVRNNDRVKIVLIDGSTLHGVVIGTQPDSICLRVWNDKFTNSQNVTIGHSRISEINTRHFSLGETMLRIFAYSFGVILLITLFPPDFRLG